jgi:hypothetical protein
MFVSSAKPTFYTIIVQKKLYGFKKFKKTRCFATPTAITNPLVG